MGVCLGKGTVLLQEEFEDLVLDAIDELPRELLVRLDNVAVVVQRWPSRAQMVEADLHHEEELLGLYEGIPLTERDDYGMVLPDKIALFQGSIEAICASDEEIVEEVRRTVVHEVAHHFGIDDEALHEMGR